LEPATHSIPGTTIGRRDNKWDAVYAKEVYTDLISAPLLATNEHGKIVLSDVTPGGGGTGNVSTDGGTQYRLASWLTANKLGDSPLVVDAADVTSRGSISPASGFAVGLGSNSVPWKSMYATDVYALSAKSESILSTGADGRIQGGSLPAATTSVIGGIIVGQNLSVSGSGVLGATLPAHPVSEHSDVQYPSPPADNQMLGWNAASSKWENRVVPSMAHSLSSHTDVNLSAVVVGQVLTYVGGLERWKNVTPVVGVSKAYGNYAKLNADNTTAGVAGVDLDTNDNVQDWPINLGTAAAANETRIAEEDGVSIATGNVLTVGEAGLYVFGMSADMFNLGIVSPMYADKLFFVIKRADGTLKETPMAVHSGDATHVDGKNTSMALDLNKDEAVTYQVRYVTKDSKVHTAQVFGLRLTVHRAA